MGKGDTPRHVDKDSYDKNFLAVFGERPPNTCGDQDRCPLCHMLICICEEDDSYVLSGKTS